MENWGESTWFRKKIWEVLTWRNTTVEKQCILSRVRNLPTARSKQFFTFPPFGEVWCWEVLSQCLGSEILKPGNAASRSYDVVKLSDQHKRLNYLEWWVYSDRFFFYVNNEPSLRAGLRQTGSERQILTGFKLTVKFTVKFKARLWSVSSRTSVNSSIHYVCENWDFTFTYCSTEMLMFFYDAAAPNKLLRIDYLRPDLHS